MSIIFFIIFYCFISITNANAIVGKITISPSLTFYNNYIFSKELQLGVEYSINNYYAGGYFKKSFMNGNELFDISNKKKYKITPMQTDNENYFYGLFLKKHLLDFNKDRLYFTVFFDNVIKYNEVLEFTYANIYKSAGLRFDYLFNDIANYFEIYIKNLPFNTFISFSKDFDGMKNNVTFGFDTIYALNEVLSIGFGYNYSKDFKNRDSINKMYNHRIYEINVADLSYEAHNFEFVLNLLLSDIFINLKTKCSLSDNWGDGCGFGVGFGL